MKKGRHRRFEEARALKRSHEVDLEDLFDSISGEDGDTGEHKPEHDAWADLAEEWETKNGSATSEDDDPDAEDATDDANEADEAAS